MFNGKRYIRSLLTVPLAGLLLVLFASQQASAAPIDSLLPERSEQEITQKWNEWMSEKDKSVTFTETPSAMAPYIAGKISDASLEHALNAANFYRFLSGLEGDLVLDAALNHQAQHGAVVISTSALSHYPPQPVDMPKDFYDLGAKSASSSNLFAAYSSRGNVAVNSIEAYMDDSDASNIAALGHRRWILSTQLKKTGFGVAYRDNKSYANQFSTMQVFDTSRAEKVNYNYSLYPNKGDFPIEAFKSSQAWSVQLNPDVFAKPSQSNVRVEVVRSSDQRTWVLGANHKNSTDPSGAYFNVNNDSYAYNYAIIFRPDQIQSLKENDTFNIRITGLKKKDGSNAEITYQTRFFSVNKTQPNPGVDPGSQEPDPQDILDNFLVKFQYTADRTLKINGTLLKYANQTFTFQIYGPSPDESHIRTVTVNVDARGRFGLTLPNLSASDLNIYMKVSDDITYLITAAGNSNVTYYIN
ncbi:MULTISPECIES: CAP domain-containing protein [unclassified Paenibacillus]|uniref:CAP domain-containing protein n=1 Tax=unclassified Paenibacillus TaxID=185978 RepID=UPI000FE1F642|nr:MULTISPECIES: CAP domain-containing protein [unclassified Paenibacillus]MCM3174936.1 CAP domain-containing protein [Paenibacillus sp. MER 99-2]